MKRWNPIAGIAAALMLAATGPALAQSTGASPADPNNERNQTPAPSNTQPADPAATSNPGARVPTAPVDRREAQEQQGGATGTGSTLPPPAVPPPAAQ
ncbi:MAG: hypothetical protein K2Q28_16760 [Hyphomicrobium sp.]|nr:hypothetical protein [Hyphomicrobium sp.]